MTELAFYTNLGKIIRRRRRELDITQVVLAKRIGVSYKVALDTYIKPTKSGIEKMRTAIGVFL